MIDVYHVHLEDPSVVGGFIAAREVLRHIHVSDGNRLAPGWGHVPIKEVLTTLTHLDYARWITVEALQVPTPEAAVAQSGRHLREVLTTTTTLPVQLR